MIKKPPKTATSAAMMVVEVGRARLEAEPVKAALRDAVGAGLIAGDTTAGEMSGVTGGELHIVQDVVSLVSVFSHMVHGVEGEMMIRVGEIKGG